MQRNNFTAVGMGKLRWIIGGDEDFPTESDEESRESPLSRIASTDKSETMVSIYTTVGQRIQIPTEEITEEEPEPTDKAEVIIANRNMTVDIDPEHNIEPRNTISRRIIQYRKMFFHCSIICLFLGIISIFLFCSISKKVSKTDCERGSFIIILSSIPLPFIAHIILLCLKSILLRKNRVKHCASYKK
ncbi:MULTISPECIES: hypothetical protein [Candidatus Ichthyocystis]|uniref:Putative membrane protein n=1 Tax=Candidatus Ichthyocystis hellenicum TaxID=1561003 RepID=A0A0S4M3U6_9BURK|nr:MULTISPECIES: hypothetical protein [Ichthyocystis]CUT18305.1 putative membrane protein [Candidatus Ichthyocystis hellenicum]